MFEFTPRQGAVVGQRRRLLLWGFATLFVLGQLVYWAIPPVRYILNLQDADTVYERILLSIAPPTPHNLRYHPHFYAPERDALETALTPAIENEQVAVIVVDNRPHDTATDLRQSRERIIRLAPLFAYPHMREICFLPASENQPACEPFGNALIITWNVENLPDRTCDLVGERFYRCR